jgi:hypothetical protein
MKRNTYWSRIVISSPRSVEYRSIGSVVSVQNFRCIQIYARSERVHSANIDGLAHTVSWVASACVIL